MGNTAPIFSRQGNIQGVSGIGASAIGTDYNGSNVNNYSLFNADPSNGSFVQFIKVKPQGAVSNTVTSALRIFVCKPRAALATTLATPTGLAVGGTTGGNLPLLTAYTVKILADNHWGQHSVVSSSVTHTLTGANNALSISWNAVTGAQGYDIFVGPETTTGNETMKFETDTSPLVITDLSGDWDTPSSYLETARFIGELQIPAWTYAAGSVYQEWTYPLNIALPPSYRLLVGIERALTSGCTLSVTCFGGDY